MRLIPIFLFFVCFAATGQQRERTIFLSELGEKANSFLLLENSFEQFLKDNYGSDKAPGELMKWYLNEIIYSHLEPKYRFDSIGSIQLVETLEESGFRKDIYIRDSERKSYSPHNLTQFLPPPEPSETIDLGEVMDDFEDILPMPPLTPEEIQKEKEKEKERKWQEFMKTRPYGNENGLFLYALAKSMNADTSFMEYVELKSIGVEFSPALLAEGYMKFTNEELELWYNRVPIMIELYYWELLFKYWVNWN